MEASKRHDGQMSISSGYQAVDPEQAIEAVDTTTFRCGDVWCERDVPSTVDGI